MNGVENMPNSYYIFVKILEKMSFLILIFKKTPSLPIVWNYRSLNQKLFWDFLHKAGGNGNNKTSKTRRPKDHGSAASAIYRKAKEPFTMWKKWKESKLYYKIRQLRVNRAVYLSSIVILIALAVVLAITAATNRARKNDTELPTDPPLTEPAAPSTDETPTGGEPQAPVNTVPELSLPVSGTLSKKHDAELQVFSQTMQDYRVHLGVDIATAASADVFAAADGTVAKIWEDPMMGWCVALSHTGDCTTVYKNLSKDLAEGLAEGVSVRRGQAIGKVGDSAMIEIADEPHLHMEVTVKGLQVNPMEYFSSSAVESLNQTSNGK